LKSDLTSAVSTFAIPSVVQAIEKFKVALSLSQQTISYIQLGKVHLLKGDVGSAIDVYKKAVK